MDAVLWVVRVIGLPWRPVVLGLAIWSIVVDNAARQKVPPGKLGPVTLARSLTPIGLEGGASGTTELGLIARALRR